jgi:hypothetical protein
MTNNLWIAHTGDKCPVDPDTVVEVMVASGTILSSFTARFFSWDKNRNPHIVLYRIVEQHKADWERFFEAFKDDDFSGSDCGYNFTVEQLYQAFAARLKAEGRG